MSPRAKRRHAMKRRKATAAPRHERQRAPSDGWRAALTRTIRRRQRAIASGDILVRETIGARIRGPFDELLRSLSDEDRRKLDHPVATNDLDRQHGFYQPPIETMPLRAADGRLLGVLYLSRPVVDDVCRRQVQDYNDGDSPDGWTLHQTSMAYVRECDEGLTGLIRGVDALIPHLVAVRAMEPDDLLDCLDALTSEQQIRAIQVVGVARQLDDIRRTGTPDQRERVHRFTHVPARLGRRRLNPRERRGAEVKRTVEEIENRLQLAASHFAAGLAAGVDRRQLSEDLINMFGVPTVVADDLLAHPEMTPRRIALRHAQQKYGYSSLKAVSAIVSNESRLRQRRGSNGSEK